MIDTTQTRALILAQATDDAIPELFMDACPDESMADTHLTLAAAPGDFSEFWDRVVCGNFGVIDLVDGDRMEVPFHEADALLTWCHCVVGFKVDGRSAILVLEV